ncbi:MAG: M20/M25/M40 family metallo-hydrolase [Gammaproteobacteria bacterium]|nr:M20/M25/M40 family metallo-hydrolase [Gammaproteobacteria bacterium]NNF48716.1 M20/M25/M40 family metallo-hydrolase [Woeseiaceae bacterium]MBT8093679.1 M20/M25/M40 family metallo-hydrolase [Gammaproteobacteria bacterium]MBT8104023.1 M20/M25/M40 family metallo-hydrolase [Gammaproteobacteria bacterium]NNK24038.1 M20/M25/M40 family metallo-hydrolase [Woeseiaceae bacterium]
MIRRLMLTTCLVCSFSACATTLDENEQRMVEWIDSHTEDAIALLEETVNISSGTMNHEGVREVGDVMRRELDALGLDTEWIELPPEMQRAGHLFGRKLGGNGRKFLLIGHLDTVFEADDEFQAFVRDGDRATGPGVEDMKGGNVVIVYALKALKEIGALDDIPVVVAYTGEEEKTGRPLSISRKDLIDAGQWADVGLGFESAVTFDGSDWGTVARRSSSSWLLKVEGVQAHSSGIFSEGVGAGAVFEAARILEAFYDEVRGERELTFNVGTIQGGTDVGYDRQQNRGTTFGKTNVVARTAVVHGGIRAISQEQLDRAKNKMLAIVEASLPRTKASIEFDDSYPPMAPTDGNRALMKVLSEVNADLGRGPMKELDPLKRGAADVSFVAPYTDALAGMGVLGKGGHTPHESIDLTSMPLAIKRAAILIYRLSRETEPAG